MSRDIATSLGLDLDLEAGGTEPQAEPSLRIVPEPAELRRMEICRMFADLQENVLREYVAGSFVHGERDAPWAEWSYLALEARRAVLGRMSCRKSLRSDFTWPAWRRMLEAFGWACAYCGGRDDVGQDHVVPVKKGGQDLMRNIVPACQGCCVAKKRYEDSSLATWLKSRGRAFREAAEARMQKGARAYRKRRA